MEKTEVTKEQVISDLKTEFNITDSSLSKYSNGTFLIDKREFQRDEIIKKLFWYFSDKIIIKGQCRVENITMAYTTFHIENKDDI
jgi:hypothetical protein